MNTAGILIAILVAAAGGILIVLGLAYQPPEPGSGTHAARADGPVVGWRSNSADGGQPCGTSRGTSRGAFQPARRNGDAGILVAIGDFHA